MPIIQEIKALKDCEKNIGKKAVSRMIKGVNKRVVEITSTDHEYFEKAVLYVKADKSSASAERLGEEAREYLGRIVPVKRKKEIPLVFKLAAASVILVILLAVIYLSVCIL